MFARSLEREYGSSSLPHKESTSVQVERFLVGSDERKLEHPTLNKGGKGEMTSVYIVNGKFLCPLFPQVDIVDAALTT